MVVFFGFYTKTSYIQYLCQSLRVKKIPILTCVVYKALFLLHKHPLVPEVGVSLPRCIALRI